MRDSSIDVLCLLKILDKNVKSKEFEFSRSLLQFNVLVVEEVKSDSGAVKVLFTKWIG